MATPTPKFTDKQIKKLLEDIHSGKASVDNLPENLYLALGEYFKKGLYDGFGSTLENVSDENLEILTDLRENVYLFAAAKTYAFTNAASAQLVDEDGKLKPFNQFYDDGLQVYDQYNKNWAKAEYETTIGQAQMAEQWQGIWANKDVLSMLTFSTAGNPCPECAPFEDLTAPVDDPIWDTCLPLLHFLCECIIVPSDDAEASSSEFIDNLPMDNIPDDFKNNPGKSGEIFTSSHPYFEDAPEDAGKSNFGLEIPDED
jgi:hypothetical protein